MAPTSDDGSPIVGRLGHRQLTHHFLRHTSFASAPTRRAWEMWCSRVAYHAEEVVETGGPPTCGRCRRAWDRGVR